MSKIGKFPIHIPEGVTVSLDEGRLVVSGPRGNLKARLPLKVVVAEGKMVVEEGPGALHGLTRALAANMVRGVSEGWSKTLELSGTGYRANVAGDTLQLALGFSHQVEVAAPEGIEFLVRENKVMVKGVDKELVGQVAAKIRRLRGTDVYKHKGFRYEGEKLIKKAGKTAKAGGAS